MKNKREIVQVRIPRDTAERIDDAVARKPIYAHRQHFVFVAVEEMLKKVERQISNESEQAA